MDFLVIMKKDNAVREKITSVLETLVAVLFNDIRDDDPFEVCFSGNLCSFVGILDLQSFINHNVNLASAFHPRKLISGCNL